MTGGATQGFVGGTRPPLMVRKRVQPHRVNEDQHALSHFSLPCFSPNYSFYVHRWLHGSASLCLHLAYTRPKHTDHMPEGQSVQKHSVQLPFCRTTCVHPCPRQLPRHPVLSWEPLQGLLWWVRLGLCDRQKRWKTIYYYYYYYLTLLPVHVGCLHWEKVIGVEALYTANMKKDTVTFCCWCPKIL